MTTTLELNAKTDSRPSEIIPTFRDKRDHEFYEYILNDIPELDLELFNLINGEGIENVDQWDDAYSQSMPTSYRVEAQFVEQLMDDLDYLSTADGELPNFLTDHIDWQEVWDCELRHDYFTIEYDGVTHFFSRYF
tara:strand:+ start:314 stop:718 length:405 start_codon:yes stop_codon:yes gene_type:complete